MEHKPITRLPYCYGWDTPITNEHEEIWSKLNQQEFKYIAEKGADLIEALQEGRCGIKTLKYWVAVARQQVEKGGSDGA